MVEEYYDLIGSLCDTVVYFMFITVCTEKSAKQCSYLMCQGLSLILSRHRSCETFTDDRASLTSILLAKKRMGIRRCLMSEGRGGNHVGNGRITAEGKGRGANNIWKEKYPSILDHYTKLKSTKETGWMNHRPGWFSNVSSSSLATTILSLSALSMTNMIACPSLRNPNRSKDTALSL